jgi:hypothetical protein
MWNGKWQFTPAEIIGLLVLVEQDTAEALDCGQPMFWVHAPYDLIPCEILVYESYRLMHTLVTDTQPESGHNAVEEALLYGLCHALLEPGSEGEFTAEALQTVNALRRHARQRPVRDLSRLEAEDWDQYVLDRVLFWDRDWQLASAATVRAALLQQTEVRERLRIEEDYFDVTYRRPSARELQSARVIFQDILARARSNRSAEGVGWMGPLHGGR